MKKIIISMAFMAGMLGAIAQTPENTTRQRTINVSGMAEMEIVPDEIFVQVDLREYDKKGAGKVDIESIKNRFIKAVISLGIPDTNISVQGYSGYDGNPWWYKKNRKKNPDMMATISYLVKLSNSKKMDELVDKLDDEATQNFFIAKVSHSKMTELKKQLKVEAMKAAKDKAVYLAGSLGESVGKPIMINDPSEIGYHAPRVYSNAMMKTEGFAGDQAAPTIDFKKIKYQFEVNVTFELK
ncbi:SIMPL domain-containing protein [Segetibacter sp. 3557_3]|uniref:SIMPL domain-containing protein n=1 Tax=Segetibacter sp. 3557_3 TaxID=2547429 RepID=UPI0014046AAD|nr:SIMPL domain-containing protein [Segetibacter sp. 3557_3]